MITVVEMAEPSAQDKNPNENDPNRRDDTTVFHREIDALRTRLNENADAANNLSWDTELLAKKTEKFAPAKIISAKDPNWKEVVANIDIGTQGICIADVRTIDAIEYIAEFAADRQLTMTYGNRSFLLEPRDPNTLA
jgi:hypothetical protein